MIEYEPNRRQHACEKHWRRRWKKNNNNNKNNTQIQSNNNNNESITITIVVGTNVLKCCCRSRRLHFWKQWMGQPNYGNIHGHLWKLINQSNGKVRCVCVCSRANASLHSMRRKKTLISFYFCRALFYLFERVFLCCCFFFFRTT